SRALKVPQLQLVFPPCKGHESSRAHGTMLPVVVHDYLPVDAQNGAIVGHDAEPVLSFFAHLDAARVQDGEPFRPFSYPRKSRRKTSWRDVEHVGKKFTLNLAQTKVTQRLGPRFDETHLATKVTSRPTETAAAVTKSRSVSS